MRLKSVLDEIDAQHNLQRIPDWNEDIKGKMPKFWIDAEFSLELPDMATLKAFFMASSYLQEILQPMDYQRLEESLKNYQNN